MKKSILIGSTIAGIALVSGFVVVRNKAGFQETTWKTVEVTRKSVENLISSTGTLKPVGTVEVGTQVSGTVVSVSADYNDVVKKNQIIAELDRQPLQIKLTQVEASYLRNQALYERSFSLYERDKKLHEKGLISDEEFSGTKTNYLTQKASLEGAKAEVESARTNLKYATVRSPVDGTVIKRNVDVGQTVAASLSAPTLFVIAEDLKQMEILADVDESDIGRIKNGQEVSFNVPAFPELTYKGLVSQIRLQPQTSQNVVTYSVVVKVENADGALLPGMTANVDFVVERVENELTIPAAALRFKPSDDIIARFQQNQQEKDKSKNLDSGTIDARDGAKGGEKGAGEARGAISEEERAARRAARGGGGEGRKPGGGAGGRAVSEEERAARRAAREAGGAGAGDAGGGPDRAVRMANGTGGGNQKQSSIKSSQTRGTIWVVDDMGEIKPVVVQLGLSDGSTTVIKGRGIEEGVNVVTGIETKKQEDTTAKSRNPFMPSRPQGGRGGGMRG